MHLHQTLRRLEQLAEAFLARNSQACKKPYQLVGLELQPLEVGFLAVEHPIITQEDFLVELNNQNLQEVDCSVDSLLNQHNQLGCSEVLLHLLEEVFSAEVHSLKHQQDSLEVLSQLLLVEDCLVVALLLKLVVVSLVVKLNNQLDQQVCLVKHNNHPQVYLVANQPKTPCLVEPSNSSSLNR